MRDLRELVCVSRLTYCESDEDQVWSGEESVRHNLNSLSFSDGSSSSASRSSSAGKKAAPHRLQSSDSGFATNGSHAERAEITASPPTTQASSGPKSKPGKRKRKKKAVQASAPQYDLPKPPVLPPVHKDPLLLTEAGDVFSENPSGKNSGTVTRGDYDAMLAYMDATMVAEWLAQANTSLEDMVTYCQQGDHFVQFAHFWLSEFPEVQKQEIYQMEHEILVEEVGLAFAVGKEANKILRRDVTDLISALFREYPAKLMSSKGTELFLDYLDILTSDKAERYKKLLADVRCSTHNRQYAQWLLATRSFALVGVWSAIINFHRHLLCQKGILAGHPAPAVAGGSSKDNVYQRRLMQAVRLGFVDVVQYLVKSCQVDVTRSDTQGRSLLFSAVMHNQIEVVRYLATKVNSGLNVNQASGTGNTPLHAAANSGNTEIVKVLVTSPNIVVDSLNRQCENATPLHLAVMHGHQGVVEALVAAGADVTLKMGSLSAMDIARDFDHSELIPLLES